MPVTCKTGADIYKQLERPEPVIITLTGTAYSLNKPFVISKTAQFTGDKKAQITFTTGNILSVFIIAGNGNLSLNNLTINGENVKAVHFISSDSSGSSNHYSLAVRNCTIQRFGREHGCENLFYAYKYIVADSIVMQKNSFLSNNSNALMMTEEKDDKGYYNAEKILIDHNDFSSQSGTLLNVYRGGNDESILGPFLFFSQNKIKDCKTSNDSSLITLTGVQVTKILSNNLSGCNPAGTLILYKNTVRARHSFEKNTLVNSGVPEKDQFVVEKDNSIK